MIKDSNYIGTELELFEGALHWKKYYGEIIKPYLRGQVLEVGAGIGGTTSTLCDGSQNSWLCLEPDTKLSARIQEKIDRNLLPGYCSVKSTYSNELDSSYTFDAILYIDVIEHIERDDEELKTASRLLRKGGALIILVPAHQFLYTPFDKKIGHFRRYSKSRLEQSIPSELKKEKLYYLDSVGLSASLANKFFLRSEMPNTKQIALWDNYMVPLSSILDKLTGYHAGKSLLGVWIKQ